VASRKSKVKRKAPGRSKPRRVAKKKGKSLSATVRAVRAAEKVLGAENVKKKIRVGKTRQLTPTRQGFRALDGVLKEVQRGRRKKEREAFTFRLSLRYRGPDGRFRKRDIATEAGFPRLKDVRRRRRKGESEAAAFRRIAELEIKKAIFRAVDNQKDVRGNSDQLRSRMKGASVQTARRAMRKFKEARGLTFSVEINRHAF